MPDIVFDKKTTLELGGRSVDLYPADLSPTDDYIVVHDPTSRVAMFVDLVQPRNVPFRTLLGHPERVVERLQWIETTLDFDVIVSGHATPQMSGTKQDVVEQRRYYGDLSRRSPPRERPAWRRLTRDDDPGAEHPAPASTARGAASTSSWPLNVEGMIAWRAGKSPSAH